LINYTDTANTTYLNNVQSLFGNPTNIQGSSFWNQSMVNSSTCCIPALVNISAFPNANGTIDPNYLTVFYQFGTNSSSNPWCSYLAYDSVSEYVTGYANLVPYYMAGFATWYDSYSGYYIMANNTPGANGVSVVLNPLNGNGSMCMFNLTTTAPPTISGSFSGGQSNSAGGCCVPDSVNIQPMPVNNLSVPLSEAMITYTFSSPTASPCNYSNGLGPTVVSELTFASNGSGWTYWQDDSWNFQWTLSGNNLNGWYMYNNASNGSAATWQTCAFTFANAVPANFGAKATVGLLGMLALAFMNLWWKKVFWEINLFNHKD